jgi:hypothetical protein
MSNIYLTKWEAEYVIRVAKNASIRCIEDWAVSRMNRMMALPSTTKRQDTVRKFLSTYIPLNIPKKHLESFAHSDVRKAANEVVHLDITEDDDIRVMWSSLKQQLNQEEAQKYRLLMEFAQDKLPCRRWSYFDIHCNYFCIALGSVTT